MDEPALMTIQEVSDYLRISESTIRRMLRKGTIKGLKVGNQWRFSKAMIEEAIVSGLNEKKENENIIKIEPPSWGKHYIRKWRDITNEIIEEWKPDFIIVKDRRGAKMWDLLQIPDYSWGVNLWHSMAIELMDDKELKILFNEKKALVFDEMMQRGRAIQGIKSLLIAHGAEVKSLICLRNESTIISGDAKEYEAYACETLNDQEFPKMAGIISELISHYHPPLDVDHIVVKFDLLNKMDANKIIEILAQWGISYLVWHPEKTSDYFAFTLDRPQFFNTHPFDELNVNIAWNGPMKMRIYFNANFSECFIAFVTYPNVKGSIREWMKLGERFDDVIKDSSLKKDINRIYLKFCINLSLIMLKDFLSSNIPSDLGFNMENFIQKLDVNQYRAVFGPKIGDRVHQDIQDIFTKLKKPIDKSPIDHLPLLINDAPGLQSISSNIFQCRQELFNLIDSASNDGLKYSEIFDGLNKYPEQNISCILDNELDSVTIKPKNMIDIDEFIQAYRSFYRGEFGVWFEWEKRVQTNVDLAIQRTVAIGPIAIDQYLNLMGWPNLTKTHFYKLFVNIQHDLREESHDIFYMGWIPYIFGPIPIVDNPGGFYHYQSLSQFLKDNGCIKIGKERGRISPSNETRAMWESMYNNTIDVVTQVHISSLLRFYSKMAKISQEERERLGYNTGLKYDSLVVLASVRNQKLAYRNCWFQIKRWKSIGQLTLFPILWGAVKTSGFDANLINYFDQTTEFAKAGSSLEEKVEMYKNLPRFRKIISDIVEEGGYEVGKIILDTTDESPIFESASLHPMEFMEWASIIITNFSDFIRAVLSTQSSESEERRDLYKLLEKTLIALPDLEILSSDLESVIKRVEKGEFDEDIVNILHKTFIFISSKLDESLPNPDPDPAMELIKKTKRDGLLTNLSAMKLSSPFTVCVVDIKNIRNLPKLFEKFGFGYVEGIETIFNFVESAAHKVNQDYPDVRISRLTADNLILISHNNESIIKATIELNQLTSSEISLIDNQMAPIGLLRSGIAYVDEAAGEEYSGLIPGLLAYELADDTKQPVGTIIVTEAIFNNLNDDLKTEFEQFERSHYKQGNIYYRRKWDSERDLREG